MLDRDTIEHEARHAAAAVLLGLEVSRLDAVGNDEYQGQLRYYKSDDDQRRAEVKTLFVGNDINDGYPPTGHVRDGHDIAHLRRLVDEMRLDVSQYYRLKAEAQELAETNEFKSLQQRFESALEGSGGRLDEEAVDSVIRRWKWDTGG